jgi:hypothetical protein
MGPREKEKEQRTAPSLVISYRLLTSYGGLVRDDYAENILVGVVNSGDFADTAILGCCLNRCVNTEAKEGKEAITAGLTNLRTHRV